MASYAAAPWSFLAEPAPRLNCTPVRCRLPEARSLRFPVRPDASLRLRRVGSSGSASWGSKRGSNGGSSGCCKGGKRRAAVRAMQADDLPPPAEMSYESALELLGVNEGASFDDILRAKRRRLEAIGENPELAVRVEAAYDILLMQSLSRRRAGQVVDSSVRYADVKKPKPAAASPAWVQTLTRATSLSIHKPSNQDLATQAAVFGALAAWTYVGGLGQPEVYSQYGSAQSGSDVPGLQLALGVGASIYLLRKDNVGLGKAAALTFSALTFGGLFGGFLESWLRVDIFPLLGISSPAVLIGESSFIFMCLACLFLR